MSASRAGASAVLLPDGRILPAGGDAASGPSATAEFFGTDGTFSSAAPMNVARSNHISVVLQDGRVLVAGGITSGGGVTNAAEIYDPIANTWTSAAGGMLEARAGHTASLLSDGRVLLAGGQGPSGTVSSTVEIFNPTSGTFALGGVLSAQPGNNFITGGGYLVLRNSAGQAAGAAVTKNNFGFNVKYNRQGTNLQGNINTIVRSTTWSGVCPVQPGGVYVYQVKGNSMTSLSVDTTITGSHPYPTATFNGKASIQDITNPLSTCPVDGNAALQVTMTDKGEPGSSDTIAITVWNKSGGLWFASKWDGTKTLEQVLGGGNLMVH